MEVPPKILLVSNQQTTGPLWAFSLQKQQNLDVALEAAFDKAILRVNEENPDLIVLDISAPENEILELIKKLRVETVVPIMLLTNIRSEEFMVATYNTGIDECVLKPIGPSLFHAKVKGWLRRSWTVPANTLSPINVENYQLFPTERLLVLADGKMVSLTNLELRLMYLLMSRPNRTVESDELLQHVWGYHSEDDNTVLKNLTYRLRRKIEADPSNPKLIKTVVGVGYKFEN